MPTIQERRHRDTLAQLDRTLEQRDAAIAKLVKFEAKVKALRRQAARYEKIVAQPKSEPTPKPQPKPEPPKADVTNITFAELPIADKLDMPDFLKRGGKADNKTPAELRAIAATEAAQREHKTAKARGRIAKMKAKQTGELKRMPLEGRAALAFINQV